VYGGAEPCTVTLILSYFDNGPTMRLWMIGSCSFPSHPLLMLYFMFDKVEIECSIIVGSVTTSTTE